MAIINLKVIVEDIKGSKSVYKSCIYGVFIVFYGDDRGGSIVFIKIIIRRVSHIFKISSMKGLSTNFKVE